MGWEDREYAREKTPGGSFVPRGLRGGPGWLIGGSVITTIIVVNVVIFALAAFFPALQRLFYGSASGSHDGLFEIRPIQIMQGQLWRLITAQYLHAGVFHLLINMFVLHMLGRTVERVWSPRRFFAVYTACGVMGNLFYAILGQYEIINPGIPAVGASGSIYGILGVVAVMFPHAVVYVYFVMPMKMRTLAIVLGAIAFLTVLQRGANFGGEACHLAGLVFGVLWAWKGNAWWDRTEWTFLPRKGPRKSRSTWKRRMDDMRADQQAVDRILDKVREQGIHSLSESEKRTLQGASERLRERDTDDDRSSFL